MKKALLTLAFFLAVGASTVFGQDSEKPKTERFAFNKFYLDQMGVSAEAQMKIVEVQKKSDIEIKALAADQTLSDEDRKAKFKELSIKRSKAIFEYLTPEQRAKSIEMITRMNKVN